MHTLSVDMKHTDVPTWLVLAALSALMAALGWAFADGFGLFAAIAVTALLWGYSARVSPAWVARMHRAQPLSFWGAPQLHRMVADLARRAGLPRAPALFLSPTATPTAFTTGTPRDSAVVVSAGLLRTLNDRELAGVLAHEISHVAHRDTEVLRFAETLNTVVRAFSRAGLWLVLLSLPWVLSGQVHIPVLGVLLLIAAPTLGRTLQLVLSRSREHAADAAAVRLTRDPEGLASALVRIERSQRGLLGALFGMPKLELPTWMSTHPPTQARIERLLGYA